MTIQISDDLIRKRGISQKILKEELAAWLYQKEVFTLMQAARFVDVSRFEMQEVLAKNDIELHISPEDVADDIKTLQSMGLLFW